MITFSCPGCGKKHSAKDQFKGLQAKCLSCGAPIRVPVPNGKPGKKASQPDTYGLAAEESAPPAADEVELQLTADDADPPDPSASQPVRSRAAKKPDAPAVPDLEPAAVRAWSRPVYTGGTRRRADDEDEPPGKPAGSKNANKKVAAIGIGLVLLGGVVAAYFMFKPADANKAAALGGDGTKVHYVEPEELEPPKPATSKGTAATQKGATAPATTPSQTTTAVASAARPEPGPAPSPGGTPPPGPAPATNPSPPDRPPAASRPSAFLTAARLAREYNANAAATDRKYAGTLLEVRGTFARAAQFRPAGRGPAVPHVVFAEGEPNPVSCNLDRSLTPADEWRRLAPGQPITVRGSYADRCVLHGCELVKTLAPADERYKGREVELQGVVGSVGEDEQGGGFPVLKLEPATDGLVEILCYFRKSDAKELEHRKPGEAVTVHGICGGRKGNEVRLDNCQVVYTTGPAGTAIRVPAARFALEYEDDLRPEEPRATPAEPVAVAAPQLVAAYEQNPAAADAKYRGVPVVLEGRAHLPPRGRQLVLESNTDQRLKVHCLFTPSRFRAAAGVTEGQAVVVRGVCSGLQNRMIRCDNCELASAAAPPAEEARVTAAYYPHVAGRVVEYNVRQPGKGYRVRQQLYTDKPDGIIDVVTTRQGQLMGPSLVEGAAVHWKRNVTLQERFPMHYRIEAGFVQIGRHRVTSAPGQTVRDEIVWDPVLKLGVKAGDTWRSFDGQSTYKILGFEKRGDRGAVKVRQEALVRGKAYPVEVVHVYVESEGEVEQQMFEIVNAQGNKRVIAEMVVLKRQTPAAPAQRGAPVAPAGKDGQAGAAPDPG